MDNLQDYITDLYGERIWNEVQDLEIDIKTGEMGRRSLSKHIDGLTVRQARNIIDKIRGKSGIPDDPIKKHTDDIPEEWIYEDRYVYNADDDKYIIMSKVLSQNVVRSGNWLRGLFRAYSNWDGSPATINEVCRSYEISPSFFQEIKRIFGLTHDKEPFTPEELKGRDEEELVDDAFQQKRFNLHQKFEKKKWKETQKAAEKWFDEEQAIYDMITSYNESPKIEVNYSPKPQTVDAKDGTVVITDPHLGIDTRDIDDIPDYHTGRLKEYLQEIAWNVKNYRVYRNLNLLFLGDAIESWLGMNHKTTWQNLEKNMYGANALFTFRDLIAGFMVEMGFSKAGFVTGNHGRGSNKWDADRKGQAELVIYRMLKEQFTDVDVQYSSRIVSLPIEDYDILGLHGDKNIWKQDVGYLSKEYGRKDSNFTLVLGGHIHKLDILEDTVYYRKETCSPLFPGNDYSKDNFASSPVGYKFVQANSKGIPQSHNCFL